MNEIWNHITLEEFEKMKALLDDEKRTPEDRMVALAALVQGVSEEEILNMPLAEAQKAFALARGLDSPPKASRIRKTYEVEGWKLKITEEMNVAQWVDFQNYAREGLERHHADLLSVALVPEGKQYNEGYDMAKLKEDLKKMPVSDALAVCFFFQRRWLRSMRRILNYLLGWIVLKGWSWTPQKERVRALRREVSAMLRSL